MVRYWVVFRDDASTATPAVLGKHTQKREAVARAERFAQENPGQYFAIAMVTSRVRIGTMEWEDATDA